MAHLTHHTWALAPALVLCTPAQAQTGSDIDALSLGTGIGTALVVLLAAVIGLSVFAKVLIFMGVVPREPTNRWEALAHAMADIVGRLRPQRSIRDRRRSGRL
ncbi:hypothetical protein [Bauldia sp.]|uniref:hypothetical protein n=1 Tax=Bauldia sp. TaxID=2575872 RepID=UPI003BA97DF0